MIHLPHLETNIIIACQLRCSNCNHFVSVQTSRFKSSIMPPKVLERDLSILSKICHVGGYAMIGGEPTLHPRLVELLKISRKSSICDTLEVWTNGIGLVERYPINHQFWKSFDLLVLSVYPGKLIDDDISIIENACYTNGVSIRIMDERVHSNWTQLLDKESANDEYSQLKYDRCWFKNYSRVLDWGYFGRCCTSPFIPQLLQNREFGSDMIKVDENLTERKLRGFLEQSTFMESCRICAGRDTPSSVSVTWHETKDPIDWLKDSSGILEVN
jgi:GTP 3',8-cyclase